MPQALADVADCHSFQRKATVNTWFASRFMMRDYRALMTKTPRSGYVFDRARTASPTLTDTHSTEAVCL